jgi:hypothetical protein
LVPGAASERGPTIASRAPEFFARAVTVSFLGAAGFGLGIGQRDASLGPPAPAVHPG